MSCTVVLDPGHGGRDPGAVSNGLQEKHLNLQLGLKVAAELKTEQVLLTRESDRFISLQDRVKFAKRADADIFVSLHVNAGGGRGFESYVYRGLGSNDPALDKQAQIHAQVMQVMARWDLPDRGRKQAGFYVLKHNRSPAVLLESLFIDNAAEAALWREPVFVEALAVGVARGIEAALSCSSTSESDSADPPLQEKDQSNSESQALPDMLYTVQVGAFAQRDNARRCLERARRAGFDDAFIYRKQYQA